MQLILLGSPGAGKGTQAQALAQKLGVPHVSTGNILRKEISDGSELGKKVGKTIAEGLLVSDEIIIEILSERIQRDDCSEGFILDGFPRTEKQAKTLDELLAKLNRPINYAVNLEVPFQEILKRITGRRTCMKCASVVHLQNHSSDACPKCGGQLIQRDDDSEESVRIRLDVYEKQTKPLTDYYKTKKILKNVRGTGTPQEVMERVLKAIS